MASTISPLQFTTTHATAYSENGKKLRSQCENLICVPVSIQLMLNGKMDVEKANSLWAARVAPTQAHYTFTNGLCISNGKILLLWKYFQRMHSAFVCSRTKHTASPRSSVSAILNNIAQRIAVSVLFQNASYPRDFQQIFETINWVNRI